MLSETSAKSHVLQRNPCWVDAAHIDVDVSNGSCMQGKLVLFSKQHCSGSQTSTHLIEAANHLHWKLQVTEAVIKNNQKPAIKFALPGGWQKPCGILKGRSKTCRTLTDAGSCLCFVSPQSKTKVYTRNWECFSTQHCKMFTLRCFKKPPGNLSSKCSPQHLAAFIFHKRISVFLSPFFSFCCTVNNNLLSIHVQVFWSEIGVFNTSFFSFCFFFACTTSLCSLVSSHSRSSSGDQ